jgi:hypothetical protein
MKTTIAFALVAAMAFAAPTLSFAQDSESMSCDAGGMASQIEGMGKVDVSLLAGAPKVNLISVSDCDDETVSALATVGGTNIRDELGKNPAVVAAVQTRNASLADIIGATVEGDTVTIYVTLDN